MRVRLGAVSMMVVAACLCLAALAKAKAPAGYAPWTGPYADEIPYPTPDNVWLTIGWSNKQTSSKCIGKGTTPLCAVETDFACDIRGIPLFCQQSMDAPILPGSEQPIPGYIPFPRSGLMRYRLHAVTRVTEALAAELRAQDPTAPEQPGDVTLTFQWQMCGHADAKGRLSNCCIPENADSGFLLRRREGRWIIIEANHPMYAQHTYTYWNPRPEDRRDGAGAEYFGTPSCEQIKARTDSRHY